MKTKTTENYKVNSEIIKTKRAEKYKINSSYIKTKMKTNTSQHSENIKVKEVEKYHIQKNLKHDTVEKMRKQDPRERKTLSRTVIKKKNLNNFKFDKNFVDVQDYTSDWKRVFGPRWFRVYIGIKNTKNIKVESSVTFYGKGVCLVQVFTFF